MFRIPLLDKYLAFGPACLQLGTTIDSSVRRQFLLLKQLVVSGD